MAIVDNSNALALIGMFESVCVNVFICVYMCVYVFICVYMCVYVGE